MRAKKAEQKLRFQSIYVEETDVLSECWTDVVCTLRMVILLHFHDARVHVK